MNAKNQYKLISICCKIVMWAIYAVLAIYTISMIAALLWGFFSSFKDIGDYVLYPFGFPREYLFSNYVLAYENMFVRTNINGSFYNIYTLELAFNSMIYALVGALVSTFSIVFAAYATVRYPRFHISKIMSVVAVVFMVIPLGAADLGSTFALYRKFGIYNNFVGMMFAKAGFVGFNFILFQSSFRGLGKEYFEAANVDGANCVQILFKIMLPMVMNVILIIYVMAFVGLWNDWQTAYLFLPSMPTIAYALYMLQFSSNPFVSVEPVRLAASIIVCIPGLLVFALFGKQMMNSSLSVSGIKG